MAAERCLRSRSAGRYVRGRARHPARRAASRRSAFAPPPKNSRRLVQVVVVGAAPPAGGLHGRAAGDSLARARPSAPRRVRDARGAASATQRARSLGRRREYALENAFAPAVAVRGDASAAPDVGGGRRDHAHDAAPGWRAGGDALARSATVRRRCRATLPSSHRMAGERIPARARARAWASRGAHAPDGRPRPCSARAPPRSPLWGVAVGARAPLTCESAAQQRRGRARTRSRRSPMGNKKRCGGASSW